METFSEINIKGMVCSRCISTIKETLVRFGFGVKSIALGKVAFSLPIAESRKEEVGDLLSELGFELLSDKSEQLLVSIKQAISDWIEQNGHGEKHQKLSDYLVEKFGKNYDSISEFFNRLERMTIEKYFIVKRIEKVKELLMYTDLPLTEIAFKTGFSSAHHLSNQFKKTTKLNPSAIRQIKEEKLKLSDPKKVK